MRMTQHKAEETLRNPEKLLRSLADVSLDAIYVKDRNSRWLFANPALERIAGKSVAELLGKTDAEIYSNPEIGRAILEHDKRILDSGKPETFEEFVDLPDGRHFFISVKSPLFDEKANIIGIVGISHDITNRRRREKQLKEDQQKYKDLIETTSDFVWEVDPQGRYTYCSPQMEKLWGIKPSEMIGKTPFYKMPPEAKEETTRFFESVVVSQKPFSGVQLPSFDGHGNLIYIEVSGVPFFDDKGRLLGFRGMTRDVTERKKTEEKLQESEARFKAIASNTPDHVLVQDSELRYTMVLNPQLGLAEKDMIGKTDYDILSREDADRLTKIKSQVLETGKTATVEMPLISKKGEREFFSGSYVAKYDAKGKIDGLIGYFRNVTESKKTEEELATAQARLQEYATGLEQLVQQRTQQVADERKMLFDVLETLPAMVCLLTPDHRVAFANRSFREKFGESKGRRCYDFCFGNKRPCSFCESYKVLETGKPRHWEINAPDGSIIDVHDFPFKDVDGSPMILEMDVDITARRKTEEQLRTSSSYARNLIEASPDPLVTISADGKIADVNKATEVATGCSRDELIGSDFSCYFSEPEKARAGYLKAFTDGFVKDYPLAIRSKSGKITHVSYNATVYRNEKGTVQGVFAAARDITELRQMEKLVRDSERLAAIGTTAGMVGHDIRNPLQAIVGELYLVKSELSSMPQSEAVASACESLAGIEKNIGYINKIVLDLQDYTRPINPVSKETDLKSLCDNAISKNGLPKNIRASSEVDPDARLLLVDPDLLTRAFQNLVINAVQSMPDGGSLSVRVYKQKDDTIIEVADTGVGIPEEVKPKLFTPLFTTKAKGQGFGLAVVKRVIEAMNGSVSFDSQEGKGSTFFIRLPR